MEHQRQYSQNQESSNRGDLGNLDDIALMAAFTVTPVFVGEDLTNLCVDVTSTAP